MNAHRLTTLSVAIGAAIQLAGCAKDPPPIDQPPIEQPPPTKSPKLTPAGTSGFSNAFDGVVAGDQIYFTAVTGEGPAILKVASAGGTPTVLYAGDPLASPIAIDVAYDGNILFIADPGGVAGEERDGAIFTISTSGGALTILPGTEGTKPSGLIVGLNDALYFTGEDVVAKQRAVLKITTSSGDIQEVIASGEPLVDPSGLAVDANETVFVIDTAGTLYEIKRGGRPEAIVENIRTGYPAGLALTLDEKTLIVSARDPDTGNATLLLVDVATRAVRTFNMGIENEIEPAGLHRAKNADDYAWGELLANRAGAAGNRGTIFRVTLE